MTNKAPQQPFMGIYKQLTVPEDAIDLMEDFAKAGAEGSFVYGGYARDAAARKGYRDIDLVAKFAMPAEGTNPRDFAEETADRIFDQFHRTTRDVHVAKYRFDEERGLYMARLKMVSQGVPIDLLAVAGPMSLHQMLHAQVMGADAPINSFAMTQDGKVYGDNRAGPQLAQRIYQPAPDRDHNEVQRRFEDLARRYKGLQKVEPDYTWTPAPRLGFAGIY